MVDYRADPWSWDTVSEWDYPPQEDLKTMDLPIPGDLYTRPSDPLSPGGLGPASGVSTRADLRQEASGLFTGPNSFARTAWETAKSLPGTIARAVDFPAAALRGEVDPLSDEGLGRAADLAGTVTLGGGAVPRAVSKGAINSGMARSGPIQTAAIRVGDQVYAGPTHGDIMSKMPADAQKAFWDRYDPKNEGFVTSKGDYVDREQAFQMAYKSGQIEDTLTGQPSLSSEDLEFGRRPSLDWDDDSMISLSANSSKIAGAVPLFSKMQREAAVIPQPKAPGQQWSATLKNKGVPQEEMDWTGVADWLKERGTLPVTKEELLAEIGRRQTQVGTKRLGETRDLDKELDVFEGQLREANPHWTDDQIDEAVLGYGEQGARSPTNTKYSQYQLPGGENYREVLLTLPPRLPEGNTLATAQKRAEYYGDDWFSLTPQKQAEYIQEAERGLSKQGENFTSSHWDEPNVLAHMRVNDRVVNGPSGPMRTMFAEEIQSDWHQRGRREGYASDADPERFKQIDNEIQDARNQLGEIVRARHQELLGMSYRDWLGTRPSEAERRSLETAVESWQRQHPEYTELTERIRQLEGERSRANSVGKVPNAPFKKTWPDLILRRLVADAVEGGYDAVAWTDGATQAARYDLSKHVKSLSYDPSSHQLKGYNHNGTVAINETVMPEKLPDYIGKEASDKILNSPTKVYGGMNLLSGVDLQVGGEGMRAFYDQELPRRAKKLFGRYGARVEDATLDQMDETGRVLTDESGSQYGKWQGPQIHLLRITPEMRAAVQSEGLPLFSNKSKAAGAAAVESEEEPQYHTAGRFKDGGTVTLSLDGEEWQMPVSTYQGNKMPKLRGRKTSANVEDRRASQEAKVNRAAKVDPRPLSEVLVDPTEPLFNHKPPLRGGTPFQGIEYGLLDPEPTVPQNGDLWTDGLIEDPTPGRTDRLPTDMPADSYVIPADIVSALGQGNTLAGGKILDAMFSRHRADGGRLEGDRNTATTSRVPVIVAGGEYTVSPDKVLSIGGGDHKSGHKVLDSFVKRTRLNSIQHLKRLPGPAKS